MMKTWMRQHLGGSQLLALQDFQLADVHGSHLLNFDNINPGVQSLSWIEEHVSNGPQGKFRPAQLLIVCCCAAKKTLAARIA